VSLFDAIVGIVANAEIASASVSSSSTGDFTDLNALLSGVTILLPNAAFEIDVPWPFTHVDVSLTNMKLRNVKFDNLLVTYRKVNANTLDLNVRIVNANLDISLNWWYDFGWTSSGSGSGSLRNSDISLTLRFQSSGSFEQNPPTSISVPAGTCSPSLQIQNLNFQGSLDASIANLFKSAIAGLIEDEVSTLICTEYVRISLSLSSLLHFPNVFLTHSIIA
jgi:hypothetical protein